MRCGSIGRGLSQRASGAEAEGGKRQRERGHNSRPSGHLGRAKAASHVHQDPIALSPRVVLIERLGAIELLAVERLCAPECSEQLRDVCALKLARDGSDVSFVECQAPWNAITAEGLSVIDHRLGDFVRLECRVWRERPRIGERALHRQAGRGGGM